MRLSWNFKPARIGGVIGASLTVLMGFVLLNLNLPIGKRLVHFSYDLPFVVRPTTQPDEVIMVYLNDESHEDLNQPYTDAWDRTIHARLVNRLTVEHARAVVFDIVFNRPSTNDETFAAALRANGRVILAADYVPQGFGQAEGMQTVRPAKALRDAAAGWGVSQLISIPDFLVRRHYYGPIDASEPTYSESWAAAKLCGAPGARTEGDRVRERWVNYYGPPAHLPAVAINKAMTSDGLPSGLFSNKVVFVGSYLTTHFSGERKDEFKNPYTIVAKGESTRAAFMPGAEVHATIFLNLLRGDWLVRSPEVAELIGLILMGALFGYGLVQFRPLITILLGIAAALLVILTAYLTFSRFHFWFPWLVGLTQIGVALGWAIAFNSIQLYVQKKLLERTLAFYLSPKLVKKFSGDREIMKKFMKPGAEKQTITIVFTDIANFTSISERMDSDDLAQNMNRYFETAVSGCIHPTDGTVVKYIGDAIFAFWNAPDDQPDHQFRACQAALNFRDQEPQYMNGRLLITRIGLHTGVANVGNFGSTERVDYTALGENINLASRMEGLNKYLGTTVLATGETCGSLSDRMVTRFCGVFRLKGFERAVEVYELVDPLERAEATRAWRETFAVALRHFQAKEFEAASAAFRRVLELRADDGPSLFYVQKIADLLPSELPSDWKGEIELKEK